MFTRCGEKRTVSGYQLCESCCNRQAEERSLVPVITR